MYDGQPAQFRRVRIHVGSNTPYPSPWFLSLVGTERIAVEVITAKETLYLDDEDTRAWFVMTVRQGDRWAAARPIAAERVIEEVESPSEEEVSRHYRVLGS